MTKQPDASVSLINAYRNLAALWRSQAEVACESSDPYRVHRCISEANACENKAKQIERTLTQEIAWRAGADTAY